MREITPKPFHLLLNARHKSTLRVISLSFLMGLSACSTTYDIDPDKGRVFTSDSSAVVGPLVVQGEATEQKEDEPQSSKELKPATSPPVKATPLPAQPLASQRDTNRSNAQEQALVPQAKVEKKTSPAPVPSDAVPEKPIPYGVVKGQIQILGEEGKPLPSRGIIVTLKPTDGRQLAPSSPAMTHVIDMENKTYQPRYLSINAQDSVSFVNKDKIKHNVFSSTGKNAFDLGTYAAGKQRQVTLNSEGIVKVYCNIHAEMATFIAVNDGSRSAISDEQGNFQLDDVEPGEYSLRIWHIRGEKTLQVSVAPSQTAELVTTLDTANYQRVIHKNKFGKKYRKNADIFDDEFY